VAAAEAGQPAAAPAPAAIDDDLASFAAADNDAADDAADDSAASPPIPAPSATTSMRPPQLRMSMPTTTSQPRNPRRRRAASRPAAVPASPSPADDFDDADQEALVQLSSPACRSQAMRGHAYLQAQSGLDDLAPANEEQAAPDEPGFVKRDRQRQKYGKAATMVMASAPCCCSSRCSAQAVTTFRNSIAATVPTLKPALTAACQTLGCKIELPTQIDDLTIEQGELQTLSDTTFSFTTLLRNQSSTAQAWPSIELVLDDDKDKPVLRRVFTPRDYLQADVAVEHGFAPHTEQAVKLYFELHDLKASGYHIAVFYP
jgi:hypothetical protein